MITAVICDLDGLLANTEKHHIRAYRETLAGYGVDLSPEEYIDHWNRNGRGVAQYIEMYRLPLDAIEVRARKALRYRELVQSDGEAMPGAVSFLKRFQGVKRLALASNSFRTDIELVIGKIDIANFFEIVVSGNDVRQAKPAPDIFLKVADILGVEPPRCVVIEDAQMGVEAAYLAGMKCIAVPNEHTASSDFSKATAVVSSLDDITLKLIDSLE